MVEVGDIYISVDVETDGPIPGSYSMLSIGAAEFSQSGGLLGTFRANISRLDGAQQDPGTMQWWSEHPDAYDAATKHPRPATEVMRDFAHWATTHSKRPTFVAYPAGFDFTFVYWYLITFVGKSPFSFSALDLKTLAMAILNKPYRAVGKRTMPKRWFPEERHTHVAVEDAIEQGKLFFNMLRELRGG